MVRKITRKPLQARRCDVRVHKKLDEVSKKTGLDKQIIIEKIMLSELEIEHSPILDECRKHYRK